ncbi:MAG: transmission trait enhancer LetE [Legionellaceae bacterium]|nr:transmission trait enhancer LetE [Legionellaceae bacterium]
MSDSMLLLPHVKFRFNLEHPTFEESYLYGYECARADISEDENPFVMGSKESEQWVDGWWAGFYGEQPAFVLSSDHDALDGDGSANDHVYHDNRDSFLIKFLEISGVLVMSAIVGYQLIELVA